MGRERYRSTEIVSSDALRAVVGSGPADLDASRDAFALLEQIVSARIGRGLTTVVDTLGLDADRRQSYLAQARAAGLPAVLVIIDTAPALCRERNAGRDRPVPAPVLAAQLRKRGRVGIRGVEAASGWDRVIRVGQATAPRRAEPSPRPRRSLDRAPTRRGCR